MKKILLGIIIGIVISVPTTIFADEVVSIIGKNIESEVDVTVLGQKLDKKAPLLDGTTYVPIRSVTEKLNLVAEFVNGEVIIKRPNQDQIKIIAQIDIKNKDVEELNKNIGINNKMIEDAQSGVYSSTLISKEKFIEIRKEMGIQLETDLAKLESEISKLQEELAMLQAQK